VAVSSSTNELVPETQDLDHLADIVDWARRHLHEPLGVGALARRALMSRRSFIRHFKAATGSTPHAWLRTQRLDLAEELLETTDLTTDQIADKTGYSSATVLREQLRLRRGLPPGEYRRTFTDT
jgi:transcriptional regulator GlxA family with amidase domain